MRYFKYRKFLTTKYDKEKNQKIQNLGVRARVR